MTYFFIKIALPLGFRYFSMAGKMSETIGVVTQVMDSAYGPYRPGWTPAPFGSAKRRYLWTDAHGVCNYLSLFCETSNEQYLEQAKELVSDVHNSLGRGRDGSNRLGNSSVEHPLNGGLRIGKTDDEDPGMSGDGQYFHYLTKWMFALNRMSLVTSEPQYNQWAVELIKAVHFKFCTRDKRRMYWKMSIELTQSLTPSEGGLDTFDGLTMYYLVQNAAKFFGGFEKLTPEERTKWEEVNLKPEIDHMKSLVTNRIENYSAHDTLDAGEALWLAHFFPDLDFSRQLKNKAAHAVEHLWQRGAFEGSPSRRLAFREFGTTIGVQMHPDLWPNKWNERVGKLHSFWLKKLTLHDNDITPIMYCTSLMPGVFKSVFQAID